MPKDLMTIEKYQESFNIISSEGSRVKFEKESLYAKQCLINNTYLMSMAKGDPESLKQSILAVATTDISLDPVKKHAYLVPMDKKVNLYISFKGLKAIAVRSGNIKWVQAELVYENDYFKKGQMGDRPTHEEPDYPKPRGKIIKVYCVAKLSCGDYMTTVMSVEECLKRRDASVMFKKNGKGPWKDWPLEMMKKTVIRHAVKDWPEGDDDSLSKAIFHMDKSEGIEVNVNDYKINEPENNLRDIDYERKITLINEVTNLLGFCTEGQDVKNKFKFLKENIGIDNLNALKSFSLDQLDNNKKILTKIMKENDQNEQNFQIENKN